MYTKDGGAEFLILINETQQHTCIIHVTLLRHNVYTNKIIIHCIMILLVYTFFVTMFFHQIRQALETHHL